MKNTLISVEQRDNSVAIITLKRNEKRNALNIAMMNELFNAFNILYQSGCRVAILTAEGNTFCSGVDLNEIGDLNFMESSIAALARMLTTIFSSQIVTIAAVQGDAMGGGCGLVAACDLVFASEEASFGFPETRRGLVAAQVATLLMRQINLRHIRELLLTGESINAKRAFEVGIVNKVVKKDELIQEALNCAEKILLGAPNAVKMTKQLLADLTPRDFPTDLQHSLVFYRAVRQSREACDRIASFLKKD